MYHRNGRKMKTRLKHLCYRSWFLVHGQMRKLPLEHPEVYQQFMEIYKWNNRPDERRKFSRGMGNCLPRDVGHCNSFNDLPQSSQGFREVELPTLEVSQFILKCGNQFETDELVGKGCKMHVTFDGMEKNSQVTSIRSVLLKNH